MKDKTGVETCIMEISFLTVLFALCACEQSEMDTNGSGATQAEQLGFEITNGIVASDSFIESSIRLSSGGYCSGTIVSQNAIITAAHCVAIYDSEEGWKFDRDNVDLEISTGQHQGLKPSRILVMPGYRKKSNSTTGLENRGADISILEFPKESFKTSNVLKVAYSEKDAPKEGDYVMVQGYGRYDSDRSADGQKRYGFNRIDEIVNSGVGQYIRLHEDNTRSERARGADSGTLAGDSGSALFKIDLEKLGISESKSEKDIYSSLISLSEKELAPALTNIGVNSGYEDVISTDRFVLYASLSSPLVAAFVEQLFKPHPECPSSILSKDIAIKSPGAGDIFFRGPTPVKMLATGSEMSKVRSVNADRSSERDTTFELNTVAPPQGFLGGCWVSIKSKEDHYLQSAQVNAQGSDPVGFGNKTENVNEKWLVIPTAKPNVYNVRSFNLHMLSMKAASGEPVKTEKKHGFGVDEIFRIDVLD